MFEMYISFQVYSFLLLALTRKMEENLPIF